MPRLGQRLKDLLRRTLEEPRRNAHLKGMQLLSENLSPAQQDQLKLLNYFEVTGSDHACPFSSGRRRVLS